MVGDVPLSQKFGHIYSISDKKGLPIYNFYIISPTSNLAWDLRLRRGLRDFKS